MAVQLLVAAVLLAHSLVFIHAEPETLNIGAGYKKVVGVHGTQGYSTGLRVVGTGDNVVWNGTGVLINVTAGLASLEHLTLVGARMADPSVQPFGLPDLLQLAPGVPLQLLDVRIVAPSCDTLLAYQQAACAAQPSAAQEVGAGWLFTHELVAGTVTVRGVNLTCAADTAQPLAQPPCFASAVRTGDALMQALRMLSTDSPANTSAAALVPAPAYLTLLSNISISLEAVGPGNTDSVAVTRNVTIAAAAYNATAAAAAFAAGTSAAYRLLTSQNVTSLDLALRTGVLAVQPPHGSLTLAGLVLENPALNMRPHARMPWAVMSVPLWAVSSQPTGPLRLVDCVHVQPEDEFEYWAYFVTLAGSADDALRAQSAWLAALAPRLQYKAVGADPGTMSLSTSGGGSTALSLERMLYHRDPVVVPRAGPARSGLGWVLPAQRVPLSDMVGVSNCSELAVALQATALGTTNFRPVVVMLTDISLADQAQCPPGAWPGEVVLARSVALVGDVGRPFSVLDLGLRAGVLRTSDESIQLTLKGVVVVNAPMAAPSEQAARATDMGLLTHLLWAIDMERPKVSLLPYNVTVEVPEPEVRLLLPLALGQPAPPNTLPQAQLALLKALMLRSKVSAWAWPAPPSPAALQSPSAKAAAAGAPAPAGAGLMMVFSEIYVPGIRGFNVTLTTNASALLAAAGGRPFPRLPLAATYLGGPGAQPEGVEAAAAADADGGGGGGSSGVPAGTIAAIVVPSVLGVLAVVALVVVSVRLRRQRRTNQLILSSVPISAGKDTSGAAGTPNTHVLSGAASADPSGRGASSTRRTAMQPALASLLGLDAAGAGGTSSSFKSRSREGMPTVSLTVASLCRSRELTTFASSTVRASVSGEGSSRGRTTAAGRVASLVQQGMHGSGSGADALAASRSLDSFDRPPSEFEGLGADGERPAAEELAAMVATLRDEMKAAGEELVIAEVLGSGAFGVVYRGAWKGLDVAVKTLRFGDRLYGDERHRKAALKEAAICCSLHHPNVVTTYAYDIKPVRTTTAADLPAPGSTGNNLRIACEPDVREWKLYLIQEYCAGGTLRQLVDHGAMTLGGLGPRRASTPALPRIVATALEVASGMCHIHAKNIVHADLNPNNVLLQHTSAPAQQPLVVKVADFGLSLKLQPDQTHVSNARQGTLHYMAPEVLAKGQMTKAADVYGFGVILWELAHGTPPWRQHRHRDKAGKAAPDEVGGAPAAAAVAGASEAAPGVQPASPRAVAASSPGAARSSAGAAAGAVCNGSPAGGQASPRPLPSPNPEQGCSTTSAGMAADSPMAASASAAAAEGCGADGSVLGQRQAPEDLPAAQPGGGMAAASDIHAAQSAQEAPPNLLLVAAHHEASAASTGQPLQEQEQDVAAPFMTTAAAAADTHVWAGGVDGTATGSSGACTPAANAAAAPRFGTSGGCDARQGALPLPSSIISAMQLPWSQTLPVAFVSLGRSCLAECAQERPTFPQVVRSLIALQKEVNGIAAAAALGSSNLGNGVGGASSGPPALGGTPLQQQQRWRQAHQ